METPKYTLQDLPPAEAKALTEEITAVLTKYNAEIGVTSQINIMKRVEAKEESIPSPFLTANGENPETTTDTPAA